MIIDCISDLHGHFPKLHGGDLLIIAGDLTARDTMREYELFNQWCGDQKYAKIIVICGNHDMLIEKDPDIFAGEKVNFEYLQDRQIEFNGLNIYGSPWTHAFKGINPLCSGFASRYQHFFKSKWKEIPDNTDILITHGPMWGILDAVPNYTTGKVEFVGCKYLREAIERIQPKLHVFGHIHEEGGNQIKVGETLHVNASFVNEHYSPVNKPIRVEL